MSKDTIATKVDLSKEIAVALTRPDYPEGVKNVIRLCCDEIERLTALNERLKQAYRALSETAEGTIRGR